MRAKRSTRSSRRTAAERGFTLIEIMVVVVIIGLLAAIVGPQLLGRVDAAAVNRAKSDIRAIETALQLYYLDNFRYPSTEDGLEALVRNPGESAAPNWSPGGYLGRSQVPLDPWNNEYQYRSPGQYGQFDVFSYGADGQQGGEGVNADIGNWDLN